VETGLSNLVLHYQKICYSRFNLKLPIAENHRSGAKCTACTVKTKKVLLFSLQTNDASFLQAFKGEEKN